MVPGRAADLRAVGDDLTAPRRRHYVIFNPASGRGRGARRIAAYRTLLEERLPDVDFGTTEGPEGERDLTDRALEMGYGVIVAVGGDGTWSNVADRIVASGRDDVALGILPSGTGNDFGRNLGFRPNDPAEAVHVLAEGHTRTVDVGKLETPSASEHRPDRVESRHFLNLLGFGFDIAVIDAAARARFLKGALLYKLTALQQLFRFPGIRLEARSGSGREAGGPHLMLTVSNGRYFGGGFPIAPDGSVDDGKLHACLIADAPPLTRLRLFNLAEKGRHPRSEHVTILDDERFRLTFTGPPRFEMDGDVRQAAESTLEARIVRSALDVVAPTNSVLQST